MQSIVLTADNYHYPKEIDCINKVTDYKSEYLQWDTICKSKFMIGTASGVSHLVGLGNGKTLRTNSNALATDELLNNKHLINSILDLN